MSRQRVSIVGRFARVAVAVAAAGAGWFGFERFVLDADAVTEDSSPWTAVQPTGDDWTSFEYTSSQPDSWQIVRHDGHRQVTQIQFRLQDEAQPFQTVELAGAAAWVRGTSDEWSPVAESAIGDYSVASLHLSTPIRVTDAFPSAADEFVTVVNDQEVGDIHRYEVRVDAAGFAETAPIAYGRWIDSRLTSGLTGAPGALLKMDVRPDGYIVRWSGNVVGEELTWTDLDASVLLESPAAIDEPRQATAPSPDLLAVDPGNATHP